MALSSRLFVLVAVLSFIQDVRSKFCLPSLRRRAQEQIDQKDPVVWTAIDDQTDDFDSKEVWIEENSGRNLLLLKKFKKIKDLICGSPTSAPDQADPATLQPTSSPSTPAPLDALETIGGGCAPCASNSECQSGVCKTFTVLGAPGDTVSVCAETFDGKMSDGCFCENGANEQCTSGRCEGDVAGSFFICFDRLGMCETCDEDSDCLSNNCEHNRCGFQSGGLPAACGFVYAVDSSNDSLYVINTASGEVVANFPPWLDHTTPIAMVSRTNPTDDSNQLLVWNNSPGLVRVDPANGDAMRISATYAYVGSMTSYNDVLYATFQGFGNLWQLDWEKGTPTVACYGILPWSGVAGMAANPNTGLLYLVELLEPATVAIGGAPFDSCANGSDHHDSSIFGGFTKCFAADECGGSECCLKDYCFCGAPSDWTSDCVEKDPPAAPEIYTVDPATCQSTSIGTMSENVGLISSIVWNPNTNKFLGSSENILFDMNLSGTVSNLRSIVGERGWYSAEGMAFL